MAGVVGFEPTHGGVKVRCLTAWRYPNIRNPADYSEKYGKSKLFKPLNDINKKQVNQKNISFIYILSR